MIFIATFMINSLLFYLFYLVALAEKTLLNMNIAIFASGSGTNAENIARFFEENPRIQVSLILTNNPNAGVLAKARNLQIPTFVFTDAQLQEGKVLEVLKTQEIKFIVLAGFLKLIPKSILAAYPNRIVNIHPALLPKYGGVGMYGAKVHQAVLNAKETKTGISIHYINGVYDEGDIIFQADIEVSKDDSIADIESKIHKLEYKHYPPVIEDLVEALLKEQKKK